jgi:hypothetical protein
MTISLGGICIGILLIFYPCTVIALRWTPKTTTVTQYDPPAGVSPALAAYLRDNGKHSVTSIARIYDLILPATPLSGIRIVSQ